MRFGGIKKRYSTVAALSSLLAATVAMIAGSGSLAASTSRGATTTPIQHVVVIFQENVSFDHYFATYPNAENPSGEQTFNAKPGTPSVNGLTAALMTNNPNSVQPVRLDPSQAVTCDMDHSYTDEQKAYDGGLADKFVESTGASYDDCDPSVVMGYYDGNTVTALWNYAQNYAMSDNSFGTVFGPSTPGALNLVSGQTAGASVPGQADPSNVSNKVANGTDIGDLDPYYDACSSGSNLLKMSGQNIGDLLNAQEITWGWFEGGFKPTSTNAGGSPVCGATHDNVAGDSSADYIPHHEPFQYYASTANPQHLPPTSINMIGQTDQANHQYDMSDFYDALDHNRMPAVSFLKAPAYQDGHAAYSDPVDEQQFLVDTINRIERSPFWHSTAIIISYDDSDGWYDHVMPPVVNQSGDANADARIGSGLCGATATGAYPDRCGYGPRLPLIVISPYAKTNYVDHTTTDQSSILRFIEDNWNLRQIGDQSFDALAGSLTNMFDFSQHVGSGTRRLIMDPTTGTP